MKTFNIIDKREGSVYAKLIRYTFEEVKNMFEPDKKEFPEEYAEWLKTEDIQDLEEYLAREYDGMAVPYIFAEAEEMESKEEIDKFNESIRSIY